MPRAKAPPWLCWDLAAWTEPAVGSIFSNGTKRKRCPLGTGSPWAPSNAPCRANTLRLKPQALEDFRAVQKCQVERNSSAQTSQDYPRLVWHCFQWTEWRIRCDAKCFNHSDVVAFLLSYALLLLFEQTVLNHANFREAALGAMSGMCTSFYVTSIQYQGRTKTANGKIWQNNLNLPNVRNPFTPVFMEPCIGMAFLWEMMLFCKTRGKMVQGVINCIHGPSSLESVLQVVPPIIPPIARPERSSLTTRTMDSCSWSFTTNRLSLPDHAKRPTMVVYWCFLSLEWPPQPPEPILGFKNCEHIAHKLQLAITEVGEVVQCLEHPGFWWCPCWWNLVNPHKSCTYESTSATIQNPHGIVPCSIPRCHSWQTRPPSDWTNSGCVQLGWQLQSACST